MKRYFVAFAEMADEKAVERAETEANKKRMEAWIKDSGCVPGASSSFREEFRGVKIYWKDAVRWYGHGPHGTDQIGYNHFQKDDTGEKGGKAWERRIRRQ